jgi:hypothetical protein
MNANGTDRTKNADSMQALQSFLVMSTGTNRKFRKLYFTVLLLLLHHVLYSYESVLVRVVNWL